MPVFEYKALLANGSPTNGKLEANGRQDAIRVLEERGFTPLRIAETGGKPRTQAVAKAAPKKASKKVASKPVKKKKQIVGEGDYAASRAFQKDEARFVKKNKAKIPAMGKQAEAALEGPEGDSLRAAEQEAMNRSTIS